MREILQSTRAEKMVAAPISELSDNEVQAIAEDIQCEDNAPNFHELHGSNDV